MLVSGDDNARGYSNGFKLDGVDDRPMVHFMPSRVGFGSMLFETVLPSQTLLVCLGTLNITNLALRVSLASTSVIGPVLMS
jgi:hypothetical protein